MTTKEIDEAHRMGVIDVIAWHRRKTTPGPSLTAREIIVNELGRNRLRYETDEEHAGAILKALRAGGFHVLELVSHE